MTGSLQNIINYNNSSNFTFDANKIEFVGSVAQLKLVDDTGKTFNQPFTSSAGFTFDAAKTEFVAGKMQQKDQAPSNSTSWATYTTSINLSYGGGVLTGTATGGASITGNKLDLAQNDLRYVDYAGVGNADNQQLGAIKFKVTPNYTGSPASIMWFVNISETASTNNGIGILHDPSGNLFIEGHNNVGTQIFQKNLGPWAPTSGVEYEFECDYDFNTGATRLFIDGNQFGGTETSTLTRDANINQFRIGSDEVATYNSNFFIADIIVFDAVQHTANYTPGYTLPEARYIEDLITFPQFSYSGLGAIQQYTAFATTQAGLMRMNVNGKYWNGAAWVTSDDSYAQMNSPADINTNIGTLTAIDTVDIKTKTQDVNAQMDIDDLTVTYTGQVYPIDNPTILLNSAIQMDALEGYAETTSSKPANTDIKHVLTVNGTDKYWDGAAWSNSSGFAQSNTAAEIETNKAALDLTVNHAVQNKIYLNSDGTDTPTITTITINYNFHADPSAPNKCLVYGDQMDVSADPVSNATLTWEPSSPFFHGINYVSNPETVVTDSAGRFEIELVETQTVSKTMNMTLTYVKNGTTITRTFTGAVIPDQITASWNTILSGL
jgi:hypothetical protein